MKKDEDWVVETFNGTRYEIVTHDETEADARASLRDYEQAQPKKHHRFRRLK